MRRVLLSALLCTASAVAVAGASRPVTPHAWSKDEIATEAAFRNGTIACGSSTYAQQALGVSRNYVKEATMPGDAATVEAAIDTLVLDPAKLSQTERVTECRRWTDVAIALSQTSGNKAKAPETPATAASAAAGSRG